jgi:transposase-like protein
MSHLSLTTRVRRSPGGPRRWRPEDPARYLAAFARSGQTIIAFCRAAGVPLSTFTLWQRQTRIGSARRDRSAAFAAVEVVEVVGAQESESPVAITMRVRGNMGAEAELTGLDPATAVRLVRVLITASSSR